MTERRTSAQIEPHYFPLGGQETRVEFSWKLFIDGKLVARSADYFPSEEAASVALDEFLSQVGNARVEHQ